jgi:hypothetical protein
MTLDAIIPAPTLYTDEGGSGIIPAPTSTRTKEAQGKSRLGLTWQETSSGPIGDASMEDLVLELNEADKRLQALLVRL